MSIKSQLKIIRQYIDEGKNEKALEIVEVRFVSSFFRVYRSVFEKAK